MRFLEVTAVLLLMLVLYVTWPPNEEHINVVVSYAAESGGTCQPHLNQFFRN